MHASWDTDHDKMILSFWAIYLLFYFMAQKIKILKKWKKKTGWRYLRMCTINEEHVMYSSWDMEYKRQKVFVILNQFSPFYLLENPENQNFEKMKKIPGDIIILYLGTIYDNHMTLGSWDMECYKQEFLVILGHFVLPFYFLTTHKIKILKKWKKKRKQIWRYYHFTLVYYNDDHMMYGSWDIMVWRGVWDPPFQIRPPSK